MILTKLIKLNQAIKVRVLLDKVASRTSDDLNSDTYLVCLKDCSTGVIFCSGQRLFATNRE